MNRTFLLAALLWGVSIWISDMMPEMRAGVSIPNLVALGLFLPPDKGGQRYSQQVAFGVSANFARWAHVSGGCADSIVIKHDLGVFSFEKTLFADLEKTIQTDGHYNIQSRIVSATYCAV